MEKLKKGNVEIVERVWDADEIYNRLTPEEKADQDKLDAEYEKLLEEEE